jgi:hypothetical protein
MVPKERFELSRLFKHYALNVARLPFRHFGTNNRWDVINNPVIILSVKLFSCNTLERAHGWLSDARVGHRDATHFSFFQFQSLISRYID